MTRLPHIGITIGDIGGIGPEIVCKSLLQIKDNCRITIYAPTSLFSNSLYQKVFTAIQGSSLAKFITWKNISGISSTIIWGKPDQQNGQIAYAAICHAVEDAQNKVIDAIVTAPICKESLKIAGIKATGHTTLLAEKTNSTEISMAFYSEKIKTLLATIHKPLKDVSSLLTESSLKIAIRNAFKYANWLGLSAPKIAIAGLNPHAGENGMFGREEIETIIPVVESLKNDYPVWGPVSADTLYYRSLKGEFDITISLYHDQGLIPLKLLAFDKAVNLTIGLPFIRTSPDHGTAFDIVGKNKADESSFLEAFNLAVTMVQNNAR